LFVVHDMVIEVIMAVSVMLSLFGFAYVLATILGESRRERRARDLERRARLIAQRPLLATGRGSHAAGRPERRSVEIRMPTRAARHRPRARRPHV